MRASSNDAKNNANTMMIGSGTPSNHNNAPRPKPIISFFSFVVSASFDAVHNNNAPDGSR
jgi:hypothetical protein